MFKKTRQPLLLRSDSKRHHTHTHTQRKWGANWWCLAKFTNDNISILNLAIFFFRIMVVLLLFPTGLVPFPYFLFMSSRTMLLFSSSELYSFIVGLMIQAVTNPGVILLFSIKLYEIAIQYCVNSVITHRERETWKTEVLWMKRTGNWAALHCPPKNKFIVWEYALIFRCCWICRWQKWQVMVLCSCAWYTWFTSYSPVDCYSQSIGLYPVLTLTIYR